AYLPQDLVELEPIPLMTYLKRRCGIAELESLITDYESRIAACTCSLSAVSGVAETANDDDRHQAAQLLAAYEGVVARFRACDGYRFEARAKEVLQGLGFRPGDYDRLCSTFSGGWKMRILLAVILLSPSEVMLLDEPTNHLDTESMEWLEDFLKGYQGTLIAVSHDRFFLDKMMTTIAALEGGRLTVFKGNYSAYLEHKERRRAALEQEMALQEAEEAKTRAFIERFRYKASKARQVQSRLRMLERYQGPEQENRTKTVRIRFPETPRSGREVLTIQGLTKHYGDVEVFSGISLTVVRGQKIALVGVNGAGKSTLARILGGVEAPTAGTIHYGLHVRTAFFSQESAGNLDYRRTVWEEITAVPSRADDQGRRDLLGAFLFSGDDIYKSIAVLSGGEKSRVALVKILLRESNLLVLDEPTNHLDPRTKEVFHEALVAYSGTVILVSHDRYFLDRLVDMVWEIRDGRCYVYHGNYSYFVEKRRSEAQGTVQDLRSSLPPAPSWREKKREAALDRQRLNRSKREWQRRLTAVEEEIAAKEARRGDIERDLCRPEVLRQPETVKALHKEHRIISDELTDLYDRWEVLTREGETAGFSEVG
ncbi:MAG: ABC-F family ATP-binding cassette domain-containing protein, partial [Syntrophales bacterium]|nr:ABC-F family ATP-binding cassette domain-containing protein [Syntrophales bacterium]